MTITPCLSFGYLPNRPEQLLVKVKWYAPSVPVLLRSRDDVVYYKHGGRERTSVPKNLDYLVRQQLEQLKRKAVFYKDAVFNVAFLDNVGKPVCLSELRI